MRSDGRGRRRSIRVTLTVVAAGVVAVALAGAAIVLLAVLRASLEQGVTDAARLRAHDVAALARSGNLPESLSFPGEERSVIQVVDPSGDVLASTANIDGENAISVPSAPASTYATRQLPIGDGQRFLVVVTSLDTARGPLTIVSAESLEQVDATLGTVRTTVAAGATLLVGLVAALAWLGVRRSLRPVERIRTEVAEITASDLGRRVPEPPGNDEIARLAVTMNRMLDRLEVASKRQGRFVADASHELRSPLTALRAQLEIGLARPARADWPERVTAALAETDRVHALVEDLLLLARIGRSDPQSCGPCDVVKIAREEVARAHALGRVRPALGGVDRALVSGAPEQLVRALRNVLDNALRHARAYVRVEIGHSGPDVTIDVSDDGRGIPPEERERVFERFVRLDAARARDDGGTGLGLAIVREIVTAHRGKVYILGSDRGTRVRITLPEATAARPGRAMDTDGARA